MRKLLVQEFLTADGVMQAPGGPDEDRSGGFPYGGWQMKFEFDDAQMKKLQDGIQESDSFLLGRKTYDIFSSYWPNQPDDEPFAAVLNNRPKYVASRTLPEPLSWQNAELIKGDVAEAVRGLKEQDGKTITVLGSGDLVQTLLAGDLIDELSVFVFPLVLGQGKKLFREGLPALNLELKESKISEYGSLALTYKPSVRKES